MSISPPPRKRARRNDSFDEASHDDSKLSVYSWNVNGIDALLQTTLQDYWKPSGTLHGKSRRPTPPIRQFLHRHEWPDLVFLQEVKVRQQDQIKMRAVEQAVSNADDPYSPDYKAHFCLPTNHSRHSRPAGIKLYGVCTLIRKDFALQAVDRVREVAWDSEGRILIAETSKTKSMPRLAIINVYLVNGTESPYRDVVTGSITGTRHDRKLEVHKLLQAECQQLHEQGFCIIIAGDINIARSPLDGHPRLRVHPQQHVLNRADFENRFLGGPAGVTSDADDELVPLDMLDTYRYLHPTQCGYSYFTRATRFGESCDRVDMIIVSRAIISACTEAGMHQTLADRATSDHVPIFARFDFGRHSNAD